jgi:hypothetical protein
MFHETLASNGAQISASSRARASKASTPSTQPESFERGQVIGLTYVRLQPIFDKDGKVASLVAVQEHSRYLESYFHTAEQLLGVWQ